LIPEVARNTTINGEQFLRIVTQKTKQLVIIPCNHIILKIFEKYAGNAIRMPKAPSNQEFNEAIKEVCKEV